MIITYQKIEYTFLFLFLFIMSCSSLKKKTSISSISRIGEAVSDTIIILDAPIIWNDSFNIFTTIFNPLKREGLIYDHIIGHSYDYYQLANSWRPDTIKELVNKRFYSPYLKQFVSSNRTAFLLSDLSNLSDVRKDFHYQSGDYIFYRYKEGELFSGELVDTFTNWGPDGWEKVVFGGFLTNGLLNGSGNFLKPDSSRICEGSFQDGEMVGEWNYFYNKEGIFNEKRIYLKGKSYPFKIILFDATQNPWDTLKYNPESGRIIDN